MREVVKNNQIKQHLRCRTEKGQKTFSLFLFSFDQTLAEVLTTPVFPMIAFSMKWYNNGNMANPVSPVSYAIDE